MTTVDQKINQYIQTWMEQGYPDGIPDEVPMVLMRLGLAPSYKAICFALLKNDLTLKSLGFTAPVSRFYSELKRIEINKRNLTGEKKITLTPQSLYLL